MMTRPMEVAREPAEKAGGLSLSLSLADDVGLMPMVVLMLLFTPTRSLIDEMGDRRGQERRE